jgi:hypothetical protein
MAGWVAVAGATAITSQKDIKIYIRGIHLMILRLRSSNLGRMNIPYYRMKMRISRETVGAIQSRKIDFIVPQHDFFTTRTGIMQGILGG